MSSFEATTEPNVWLITGTSTGLGRHLVNSALARGDRVIATARNLQKVEDLPKSDRLRVLQLDVDDGYNAIKIKVDEAAAIWGHIDVLVNNAGTGMKGIIEEGGSELLKKQFQTNFFGLVDVTTAVLPYMRARRSGTVVLVGSRTSWRPESQSGGIYAVSKAAVRCLGETLAVELAQFSIRVLIVEPASIRTENILSYPFYEGNHIADYDDMRDASKQRYKDAIPLLKGDPVKAMELLTDVVRGEGKAKGKAWPLYLPLGHIADKDIRAKCAKMIGVLDEWGPIIGDLDLDE